MGQAGQPIPIKSTKQFIGRLQMPQKDGNKACRHWLLQKPCSVSETKAMPSASWLSITGFRCR